MARDFSKNTSNYMALGLDTTSLLINGAAKVSIAAWVNIDTISSGATDNRIFCSRLNSTNGTMLALMIDGSGANKVLKIQCLPSAADSGQILAGVANVSTGAWHHVGGVANVSGDSEQLYLDGAQDNTSAVTFIAVSFTRVSTPTVQDAIGAANDAPGTTATQVDGRICELAIWTDDIGLAGFATLAKGFSPLTVMPTALVLYWPLMGQYSPEIELMRAKPGTITGSVPFADHPPVYRARRPVVAPQTPNTFQQMIQPPMLEMPLEEM